MTNRPRWLYHGTCEAHARAALVGGLRPRGAEGASNWGHTAESNPDLVYLTDTYPAFFAARAEEEGRLAVLEIDAKRLTLADFRPDEDTLEQGTREYPGWEGVPAGATVAERTTYFRGQSDRLREFWRETLRLRGVAAYKGTVPARAIRRVALLDARARPELAMTFMDGQLTVANFSAMKRKYRRLTRWLFDGAADVEGAIADIAAYGERELIQQLLDEAGRAWWERVLNDRSGIEVEGNPGYLK